MRYTFTIFFLITLYSCKTNNNVKTFPAFSQATSFTKLSFDSLFTNMKLLEGQYVEVEGIFRMGPEESSLYNLSDTDSKKGIWLTYDNDHPLWKIFRKKDKVNYFLRQVPVIVKGRVNNFNSGHMGSSRGAIEEIVYLKRIPSK